MTGAAAGRACCCDDNDGLFSIRRHNSFRMLPQIGPIIGGRFETGMNSDTIFAVSSGAGAAGIAVIRLSGPVALSVAAQLSGQLPRPREMARRRFIDVGGDLIDVGLLVVFPKPASFTGEDVCEFHIHGGMAVQNALIGALSGFGECRAAEPGEFTRRAFRNRKLDLLAVEGLADLIHARSERQRRQALAHASGSAAAVVETWREELIEITARVTAAIDFSDEVDVAEGALRGIAQRIGSLISTLETALEDALRGELVRRGIRVVLIGPPNAGKSTILNTLARCDAAIVSPIPGTTRDTIDVTIEIAGVPVTLTDTAGLRVSPTDPIEAEGMARTYRAARAADLIILIRARNDPGTDVEFDSDAVRVTTKIDLPGNELNWDADFHISALTGEGMSGFLSGIEEKVLELTGSAESSILIRQRHCNAISDCVNCLQSAIAHKPGNLELMAEQLRCAADAIGRLTGRIAIEDLLDKVFSEFCIGK